MFKRIKQGVKKMIKEVSDLVKVIELTEQSKGIILIGVGLGVAMVGVSKLKFSSEIDAIKHAIKVKELNMILNG